MKRATKYGLCLLVVSVLFGALLIKGFITQVPTGTWAPAGNGSTAMSSPRAGAATVLLPDGNLLITGGDSGTGPVASVDIFNTSGNFSSAAVMNFARSQHTAVVLQDGRVLVAGGIGAGGTLTDTAEIYDPAANTWTVTTGPLIVARSGHTASLLPDGTVLIAGGSNAAGALNSLEIFDPAAHAFHLYTAGDLSSARQNHAAAVLQDGRVIVVGGSDGTNVLASTDIYDPATGTIAPGPPLSVARMNHTATTQLDGKVFVAGGSTVDSTGAATDLASVEVWDPAASQPFVALSSQLSVARQGHQAFLLPHNGGILIVGGSSAGVSPALSSAELYYPWTGAFNPTGSMASARLSASGSPLSNGTPDSQNDGLLLVAGGKDASGAAQQSAELYGFAWVKTDKADYAPGDLVTITGGGWKPGETVHLSLLEAPFIDQPNPMDVIADQNGNISDAEWAPDAQDVGIKFYLTATGSASQAQTTFTDGNSSVSGKVTDSTTGSGIAGATVKCTTTSGCNADFTTTTDSSGNYVFDGKSGNGPKLTFAGNGPASLTLTATATGFNSATLSFTVNNGDTVTGKDFSLTPATVGTALVLSSVSPNSVPYGSSGPVTFTVTLTRNDTSAGVVGATVNFTVDGIGVGSATTVSGGVATFGTYNPSALSVANHPVQAFFTAATVGGTSFLGSNSGTINLAVGKADQTITFGALGSKTYGDAPFTVSATGGASGNAVTFTAGPVSVCTSGGTNGSTITIVGAGSCTVTAHQAGNSNYNAAADVPQSFTVNAKTLTASIVGNPAKHYDGNATATLTSANFQLSGLVGSDSITVTKTSGTYNSKDVTFANTVTASLASSDFTAGGSTQLTNYVLPTTASGAGRIDAASLTASIVNNPTKPYDGTTNATLTPANFSLGGLVAGESFTVTQTVGTYNSKDVEIATTVTTSLAAGDFTRGANTLASNYVLPTSASGAGHITPATVTASIVGDPTKPYDGNANATLTSANFSLTGVASGESFTVTKTTGTYNSKDVETATTVTTSLAAGDFTSGANTLASNYTLPTTASGPGKITAVALTASIVGTPTKPYDGNANASLTSGNFSIAGLVGSDSITVTKTSGTYNSKDVAFANTVTASLASSDFTAGGSTLLTNYVLPTTASGAGQITAVTLTASIVNDPTKPYDGNTNATLTPANFSLGGLVAGESITVTKTSGTYNSKDVATATTVTASLAGTDFTPGAGTLASNYVLPTTASGAGQITPATVTASIVGDPTKLYDGNVNATLTPANFSLSGLASGESFTVTKTSGTYNSRNVWEANTITASLAPADFTPAAGTLPGNYTLPTTASGPGHITPATVTPHVTADNKVYDGTLDATILTRTLTGVIPADSANVTLTGGVATFSDKNVGTGKTVTVTGLSLTGTLAGDYVLSPTTATTTANITQRSITVTAVANAKVYDGNTSAAAIPAISGPGLANGDTANFTETYNDKNVGNNKALTPAGSVNDGNSGNNYAVTFVPENVGVITPAPLTITAQPNTKTYDGNTSAAATPIVSGLQNGDTVTGLAEVYTDPNAGTGKTLTVSAYTVNDGNGGNNYTVTPVANNAGVITKANPTITVTPYNVAYDGNPHTSTGTAKGVLNETLSGLNLSGTTHTLPGDYPSDPWTFTDVTGNYNNANGTVHDIIGYGVCAAGYGPGGVILPPINSDGSSVYPRKGGSTIPVKFTVCDASGAPISNPAAVFAGTSGSLTMLSAVRGTVGSVNEATDNDIPDVAFRFTGSQWIFNMATTNLQAGSTYTFRINLANGNIVFVVGVK